MDQFRSWFFPIGGDRSLYCKYNNESLQAYSAVMHFTGSIASIAASYFTQHWGRKGLVNAKYRTTYCTVDWASCNPKCSVACSSMIIAGTAFLIGSVFQASAIAHVSLLFIGRVFWGVGEFPTQSHVCSAADCAILHVVNESASLLLYPCYSHMPALRSVPHLPAPEAVLTVV